MVFLDRIYTVGICLLVLLILLPVSIGAVINNRKVLSIKFSYYRLVFQVIIIAILPLLFLNVAIIFLYSFFFLAFVHILSDSFIVLNCLFMLEVCIFTSIYYTYMVLRKGSTTLFNILNTQSISIISILISIAFILSYLILIHKTFLYWGYTETMLVFTNFVLFFCVIQIITFCTLYYYYLVKVIKTCCICKKLLYSELHNMLFSQ